MSTYREKLSGILIFFCIIILLAFGIGSLANPYGTLLLFIKVVISIPLGAVISLLFNLLIKWRFGIRRNIKGDLTVDYKFTTKEFALWFGIITIFSTVVITLCFENLLYMWIGEWMERVSTNYRASWIHWLIGILAIILAIGFGYFEITSVVGKD